MMIEFSFKMNMIMVNTRIKVRRGAIMKVLISDLTWKSKHWFICVHAALNLLMKRQATAHHIAAEGFVEQLYDKD